MVSFAVDRPGRWRARAERRWRRRVTQRCLDEVAEVYRDGTEVTVVGPGPEELEAIGGNLMAVDRRRHVLEVSLRTSAVALGDPGRLPHPPVPFGGPGRDGDGTAPRSGRDGGDGRGSLDDRDDPASHEVLGEAG